MIAAEYWIWLSMALGAGARVDEILEAFPSPEMLYNENRQNRTISGVFTKSRLDRLESTDIAEAHNAVEVCNKNGWKICTPDSENYPGELLTLSDMPLVLFSAGDPECLKNRLAIGVVGTRNPTYDSVAIAKKLSADMASAGAVIVSGGAMGIDAAAHEGAITAGGKTICVMGCGLGTRYLAENSALRREITQNGAVISEYLPFSSPTKATFPIRNRIISGLSRGVLVVEAGEKSGSLITAKFAREQGRDIFAVPGSILVSSYKGANGLIKDGAGAVTCADDILNCYKSDYSGVISDKRSSEKMPVPASRKGDKKIKSSKVIPEGISDDAVTVFKAMGDDPLHSDELCEITGLPAGVIMAALMELELSDAIEQTEGKLWIIK